jgi:hypothetical protein
MYHNKILQHFVSTIVDKKAIDTIFKHNMEQYIRFFMLQQHTTILNVILAIFYVDQTTVIMPNVCNQNQWYDDYRQNNMGK